MKMELSAQAKINLALDIVGVDGRGYHLLDMLMQSISISDTMFIEDMAGQDIELSCPNFPSLENASNIVYKAARLLQERFAVSKGARITLVKKIPQQAGMGGGSADAAAALLGLRTLWNVDAKQKEMASLALELGADVPFALSGGLARARGVGEVLNSLPSIGTLHFACAMPETGLDTRQVYSLYDRLPKGNAPDIEGFLQAFAKRDWNAMQRCGGNVLEVPAFSLMPEIESLKASLYELGAVYAAMTGSGAAVFGLFGSEAAAKRAVEKLRIHAAWAEYAHSTNAREES